MRKNCQSYHTFFKMRSFIYARVDYWDLILLSWFITYYYLFCCSVTLLLAIGSSFRFVCVLFQYTTVRFGCLFILKKIHRIRTARWSRLPAPILDAKSSHGALRQAYWKKMFRNQNLCMKCAHCFCLGLTLYTCLSVNSWEFYVCMYLFMCPFAHNSQCIF